MDILKERIMQDGKCYPGGILKVDSFINHQMDPNLMMDVAKEFVRLFDGLNINKIVTIEASGIAPAILVGYLKQLPEDKRTLYNIEKVSQYPLPQQRIEMLAQESGRLLIVELVLHHLEKRDGFLAFWIIVYALN